MCGEAFLFRGVRGHGHLGGRDLHPAVVDHEGGHHVRIVISEVGFRQFEFVGAAVGGGAGAAVGSKSQGGSNRNATYSGVGGAVGSAVGKSIFGGNAGAAIGGAIGGGAGAAIEQNNRRR